MTAPCAASRTGFLPTTPVSFRFIGFRAGERVSGLGHTPRAAVVVAAMSVWAALLAIVLKRHLLVGLTVGEIVGLTVGLMVGEIVGLMGLPPPLQKGPARQLGHGAQN